MIFEVSNVKRDIDKKQLEKVAKAAFSVLGEKEGEISLKFVTEKEIATFNARYRRKEGATDVLSFILGSEPLIGQILICYTKAVAQADEYHAPIMEEITRLTIHGICHLYGYDHETVAEEQEMKAIENNIWESIQ